MEMHKNRLHFQYSASGFSSGSKTPGIKAFEGDFGGEKVLVFNQVL